MIKRLLIANRGEIACRIANTAHAMGIETVAIASSIETDALHARMCDHAVHIGPADATESYLNIDRVIEAATSSGADAIHPGYGFLAENAEFARAVAAAGLRFVGPSPSVIETLGSKLRSSELAETAGIPSIPRFARDAVPDRFPVMVKAADGGGGKGMSIVREPDALAAAIESAERIALASFGSSDLIIEEYVEGARHIEVQILGDSHGRVVHLGERECSVQRRHQKVIEEAPAPNLPPATRDAMTTAAVALATNVGYESAGTVEMVLAPDGRFFFLEVNTRLQVEHAVTEMTTGIDIVREQLLIASGQPLSFEQDDIELGGSAIEARIYAEDPPAGDLPATGTIVGLLEPESPDVRVDSGLLVGQAIGINYDPMLAKIIAAGSTRGEALARLRRALGELRVVGVSTNRSALRRALGHEAFVAGSIDTGFWKANAAPVRDDAQWAAIAAVLFSSIRRVQARPALSAISSGFRLGGSARVADELRIGDETFEVHYRSLGGGTFEVDSLNSLNSLNSVDDGDSLDDGSDSHVETVRAIAGDDDIEIWRAAGNRLLFDVVESNVGSGKGEPSVFVSSTNEDWAFTRPSRFGDASSASSSRDCRAPMPGRVVAVNVTLGDAVSQGDTLVVLEAMKMEHPVRAPHDGKVTEIAASVGDQVEADHPLVVVEPAE